MSRNGSAIPALVRLYAGGLILLALAGFQPFARAEGAGRSYHSFYDVAFSPNGKLLAASDATAGRVVVLEIPSGKQLSVVGVKGEPRGIAWGADSKKLYVAEWGAGTVCCVSVPGGRIERRFKAGPYVCAVATVPARKLLIALNAGLNSVWLLDLGSGALRKRIPLERRPFGVSVTPDGRLAVVTNLLPVGRSTDPSIAACVSLIDLMEKKPAGTIKLPPGSVLVRGSAVSPDGAWAYVVHTVGRFSVPTTQLDRGWVSTNALSIIDLKKRRCYATVLLDYPSQGAADPWGIAVAPDASRLWVTLSGVHSVACIDLRSLHRLLEGDLRGKEYLAEAAGGYRTGTESTWYAVKKDPKNRSLLLNDLSALYVAGVISRRRLEGKGPRGIAVAPDGTLLAVAVYFSGEVRFLDPKELQGKGVYASRGNAAADPVRRGEMFFHDADLCFQGWLSCATCHPEGRADGLNWDLLNDGIGNPKNTKSLLLSHRTPPSMWRGVRPDMETAVAAGFRHILFREPKRQEIADTSAYLRSLKPLRSPYRVAGGGLSEAALRGKKIFEDPEVGCAHCHSGALLTDLKKYDVGTKGPFDSASSFDTPGLFELWLSGPYLHDGSAATLREVLTTRNRGDRHGKTSKLGRKALNDLIEYLRSL